jgi:hypothetical protein
MADRLPLLPAMPDRRAHLAGNTTAERRYAWYDACLIEGFEGKRASATAAMPPRGSAFATSAPEYIR